MSPTPPVNPIRAGLAIFAKELRCEWRTRVSLNALLLFSFAVLILVGYAVGPARISPEDRPTVHAVLLWLILFFTAMTGLSRTFVREEESGSALALRLTAEPGAVLLGKLLFNTALQFAVTCLVVPLFLGLMSFSIEDWGLFLGCILLGTFGIAIASTFTAAIVAKATTKGALFAVLAIPLLLPPLIAAVVGTQLAATQDAAAAGRNALRVLLSYDGVLTTASFFLFPAVFDE